MTPRALARWLSTVALVDTIVMPVAADLNSSHAFNPAWTGHARFHNLVGMILATGTSLTGLWLLWRHGAVRPCRRAAQVVPLFYWIPFFLVPLVPGATVDDPGHLVPRIAGIPLNLWAAGLNAVLATAGMLWDRLEPADVG